MPRIGADAVLEATGRDWDAWFDLLNQAEDGERRSHGELVAFLASEHGDAVSAWWRQTLVNEYEKHTGRRELGETLDTGYQVGATRTVVAGRDRVWAVLTEGALGRWLDADSLLLEKGADYRGSAGPSGEVRVVVPGDRVRVTWQPGEWPRPSTLQIRLTELEDGRTRVSFHHEHLPDAETREAMRSRWKVALAELAERVEAPRGPGAGDF